MNKNGLEFGIEHFAVLVLIDCLLVANLKATEVFFFPAMRIVPLFIYIVVHVRCKFVPTLQCLHIMILCSLW